MAQKRNAPQVKVNQIDLELGKVPPQALELEEAVLGAIMLEKNAIVEVMDILKPERRASENISGYHRPVV